MPFSTAYEHFLLLPPLLIHLPLPLSIFLSIFSLLHSSLLPYLCIFPPNLSYPIPSSLFCLYMLQNLTKINYNCVLHGIKSLTPKTAQVSWEWGYDCLDSNPYHHHVTQDGTVPERDVKLGVEVLPLDSWAKWVQEIPALFVSPLYQESSSPPGWYSIVHSEICLVPG